MKQKISFLTVLALAIACASCQGQTSAAPLRPGTLLQTDFETGNGWANSAPEAVGTIDVAGSTQPSRGLRAAQAITVGPLALQNSETDLGKLTLAFSLSASAARPVTVRVESFDKAKKRTGGLETKIYPAAPDFYQRYALDLSTFQPSGTGTFQPTAPQIGFTFEVGGDDWQGVEKPEIRLDNLQYAKPAYYVSAQGNNQNDGRSEATAFATPQKALNEAQPGDIIVVMNGTYHGGTGSVASFPRAGTPASWIVLKNYPGHKPTFTSNGWNIVSIAKGSKTTPYDGPALAYLELRGLHVRGESDRVKEKFPEAIGKSDGRSNSNGIAADGRYMKNGIHHLRFADNIVEYCPGQGLGALESDWVAIENNISRNNCWTTIYATSGISLLGAYNFDATDNIYKHLIRNNICHRNEAFQIWAQIGKISDGNGIILDVNQKTSDRPNEGFKGRTLVQSNLCYDNGGSGIHAFKANRVDIINNTAYLNSASKSLEYGQIFANTADDVRIINNILVAPVADVAAGEKPEPVNGQHRATNVVYAHNLYLGGNTKPVMGEGDQITDPLFINPSRDPKVADFHLKPLSPALGKGRLETFSPFLDLDGKPRGARPDIGAYQR